MTHLVGVDKWIRRMFYAFLVLHGVACVALVSWVWLWPIPIHWTIHIPPPVISETPAWNIQQTTGDCGVNNSGSGNSVTVNCAGDR